MKIRQTWLIAIILLLGVACLDEPECVDKSLNQVKIKFIQSENLLQDTLQIDSIMISNSDSSYYKNTSLTELTLPLNPGMSEIKYFFDLVDGEIDFEIVLGYSVVPRVVSEECGIEAQFGNLLVISHQADSVIIVSNTFNETTKTNVKVYR